jgi:hypothetical protein
MPVIAEIRAKGSKTPTTIAAELNNLGLLSPKGNLRDNQSVRRLLGRRAALTARPDSPPVVLDAINERSSDLTADYSTQASQQINDPCGAIRRDLLKVV